MSAKDTKPYTGKRKALLDAMLDPDNAQLDVLNLCKVAGCSRESYYKYTKEVEFLEVIKEMALKTYGRSLLQSVNRVVSTGKRKDKDALQANKLIQEACGLLNANKGNTVNVAVQGNEAYVDQEYANDADLLADIDRQLDELNDMKRALTSSNRIKGDGIHPPNKDAREEGE